MDDMVQKTTEGMSRRSFLKASALAASALALTGCDNTLEEVEGDKAEVKEEGEWIAAACWHNCGGRCVNKAYVVDGVVMRQKTDSGIDGEDSWDNPQQRACCRGRSQQQQVFGADRLKYPMKRKHWEPLTGGDKSLRGRDEWERISWDEALDYVAAEIKHAVENYGNRSIYLTGWAGFEFNSWRGGEIHRMMYLYGGCVRMWSTSSEGNWLLTAPTIGYGINGTMNTRYDLLNTETIIMFGQNPNWSSPGNPSWLFWNIKEKANPKFIVIDPCYTDTCETYEAEWIPIRVGTDTAFLLGACYAMLEEDDPDSNPLIDWDFLHTYSVGFDAESMPEGEDPEGNFMNYVLGKHDGIPKTPEWASKICGASPEQIRMVARENSKQKKVSLLFGYAPARTYNTDNLPQLYMTFGLMGGHMGKPGHCTGLSKHRYAANNVSMLFKPGTTGLDELDDPVDDVLNTTEQWKAVLEGSYNYTGYCLLEEWLPSEKRDIDIHLIYHPWGACLQTMDGMSMGIEAHRKVDFVVSHAQHMTTNALYSDIVLPVITEWEKFAGFSTAHPEALMGYFQITEPLYEAKHDQWIAVELGKKLGISEEDLYPLSFKQQYFNILKGCTRLVSAEEGAGVNKVTDLQDESADGDKNWKNTFSAGEFVPLFTITQEDIDEMGVEGEPQEGSVTLAELRERGCVTAPRSEGDQFMYYAFSDFISDPEANPRPTPSGKFEIHCRTLSDLVNSFGWSKIEPIPTYIPSINGYESTFDDFEKGIKGKYPYQLYTPHYLRRSHSCLDNSPWLREAWTNPVYLSAADAADKGIVDGDTCLVYNDNGKLLRNAVVTERLMPGIVALPHGAWVDMDEETGIDRGGADNILTGQITAGQGTSGWNSVICNVEKYDGEPLIPDCEKPLRVYFSE